MTGRLSRIVAAVIAAVLVAAGATAFSAPASAATGPAGEVFALVNQQRAANGVAPLMSDPTLDNAALAWANYLAQTGQFMHSSSDWRHAMIGGQGWVYSGENIAAGYGSASAVMSGWMNSAGHRANILNSGYAGMGVAYVQGGPWGTYWVQIFAASLPRVSPGNPPVIAGTPSVGGTLTATTSGWPSGTSIGWTWYADGRAIPGANSATYTPTISDQNRTITVTASGWKPGLYTSFVPSSNSKTVTGTVTSSRLAGSDRYATAVAISQAGFAPGVPVVYVASGENFPDALAAAPAASLLGGPLLLTSAGSVPSVVVSEVRRLDPDRIVVVGGPGTVSNTVFAALSQLAPTTRIAGDDRFDTSRRIVDDAFASSTVAYVATGLNFPDALTASAAAAHLDGPVVLVNGGQNDVDAGTVELLEQLGVTTVRIAGGYPSVSAGIESDLRSAGFSVERLAGQDRFDTAIKINAQAFSSMPTVYLASGLNFPDALAGAALAGNRDAPLFVAATGCIPDAVTRTLTARGTTSIVLLGGTPSLSGAVAEFQRC